MRCVWASSSLDDVTSRALTRVADVNLNVAVAVDVVGFALDPLLHPVRAGDVNAQNLKSMGNFSCARSLACSFDAVFVH